MPARRIASSLVPMPMTYRPNTVRVRTTCPMMTIASAIRNADETPSMRGAARPEIASPTYCVRESVTT
ncbi:hypothetical protein D3C81_2302440 [compost metagenome]